MTSGVFDSTIVIDHLNGVEAALEAIETEESPTISIVTWVEVLVGLRNPRSEAAGRRFLRGFEVVGLTQPIAEEAVRIRRERRLKLPDAIILATAHQLGVPLITRNTKDFDVSAADILVPYTL